MIITAFLVGLAAQAAASQTPTLQEAVVIGRRLRSWRGRVVPAGADMRCVTIASTGDAEVDQVACGALLTCFTPMRPRMDAAARQSRSERRAVRSAVEREIAPCVTQQSDRLVTELVERRFEARQGRTNASN